MNNHRLYEATEADAELIVWLMHTAFEQYRNVLAPPSGVHRETPAAICEKMKTARIVLAAEGDQALGCVMYEPRDDSMYLGRLSVLPQARGRGIARELMSYVENVARREGFTQMQLGVRLALTELRAMYERKGYRVAEYHTHEGYAEPTFVTMVKRLE
jgi:ribosomal protein S18 acetylase RimI-like enzyme